MTLWLLGDLRQPRILRLGGAAAGLVLALVALLGAALGAVGGYLAAEGPPPAVSVPEAELAAAEERARRAEEQVAALSARLAALQARIIRLDALGRRLVDLAGLDPGEFDFAKPPPQGGPAPGRGGETLAAGSGPREETAGSRSTAASPSPGALAAWLERLEAGLDGRARGLVLLESYYLDRRLRRSTTPRGRPVRRGWLSSLFGWRTDPFTGLRAFHQGVDVAGREGEPVRAVADGVVTWAGRRYGYGRLVEIAHGRGYVTRYGHNKEILVRVGQRVRQGEVIARMGSTGRSTGPHVHFEVLRDGRPVNPLPYLRAAR